VGGRSGIGGDAAPGGFQAWSAEPGDVQDDAAACQAVAEAEARRTAQRGGAHASRQQVRRPPGLACAAGVIACCNACAAHLTTACSLDPLGMILLLDGTPVTGGNVNPCIHFLTLTSWIPRRPPALNVIYSRMTLTQMQAGTAALASGGDAAAAATGLMAAGQPEFDDPPFLTQPSELWSTVQVGFNTRIPRACWARISLPCDCQRCPTLSDYY